MYQINSRNTHLSPPFWPTFPIIDPFNPEHAVKVQKWYMNNLYNRKWNTGSIESRKAKSLAAYNMGATKLVNVLNKMKADGIDIYDSTDWVNKLSEYHKSH